MSVVIVILSIAVLFGVVNVTADAWNNAILRRERGRRSLDARQRMQALLSAGALPPDLAGTVSQVARYCQQLDSEKKADDETRKLMEKTAVFSCELAEITPESDSNTMRRMRVKALNLKKALLARMLALGTEPAMPLPEGAPGQKALEAGRSQPEDAPEASALASRIGNHRDLASSLSLKGERLPKELRGHIKGIVSNTESILVCMSEDPRDVAPGERFLARYLPAAHTLVDKYIQLSEQGGGYESVNKTLEKSRDIMTRLEQAFVTEHSNLLRNDADDFSAEISMLDTLLKMDGK